MTSDRKRHGINAHPGFERRLAGRSSRKGRISPAASLPPCQRAVRLHGVHGSSVKWAAPAAWKPHDNGMNMKRQIHLQLHSGGGGQPTRASRLKGIAIGLFSALLVAALLFVALILGSVIAVVIGIVVIATISFVIVRGAFMGSVSSLFNRRRGASR